MISKHADKLFPIGVAFPENKTNLLLFMLLCRLSFEVHAYSSSAFRSQSNRTRFIRLRRIRIRHHPTPNVPRAGPQTHHDNHLTSIFKRKRSVNHQYSSTRHQVLHHLSRLPRQPPAILFSNLIPELSDLMFPLRRIRFPSFTPTQASLPL